MKEIKMVCFDMDGTIADLYGVEGWEYMLRNSIVTPYEVANPMWDMVRLANILNHMRVLGVEVRIITWLSMDSTEEYKDEVRRAKREWLERMGFPCDHFHGVAYGTTKADCVRRYLGKNEKAILIDDSAKVRKGWHLGETVDPVNTNIVDYFENFLHNMKHEKF